jgi:hypothetical protein
MARIFLKGCITSINPYRKTGIFDDEETTQLCSIEFVKLYNYQLFQEFDLDKLKFYLFGWKKYNNLKKLLRKKSYIYQTHNFKTYLKIEGISEQYLIKIK